MTLVEVAIFSADHSLAAVDLRSLERINSASVLKKLGEKTALVACKIGTGVVINLPIATCVISSDFVRKRRRLNKWATIYTHGIISSSTQASKSTDSGPTNSQSATDSISFRVCLFV